MLIEILAPSELWYIGMHAFFKSTLSSIKLPMSLKTIGHAAFADTFLTEINIPGSVIEFEGECQFNSSSIKSVYVNWEEPLMCEYNVFGEDEDVRNMKTLYVPLGTKDKYSQWTPWSLFGEIIEYEMLSVDEVYIPGHANTTHNIYNVSGILIKRNASRTDIENLPSGFYIIDGRKVSVK